MKFDGITFRPMYNVSFTRQEAEQLAIVAEHHYDYNCRLCATKGFLHGILNFATNMEDPVGWGLDFRDLDTLCKILEQLDLCIGSKLVPVEPLTELRNRLWWLIRRRVDQQPIDGGDLEALYQGRR